VKTRLKQEQREDRTKPCIDMIYSIFTEQKAVQLQPDAPNKQKSHLNNIPNKLLYYKIYFFL